LASPEMEIFPSFNLFDLLALPVAISLKYNYLIIQNSGKQHWGR
jgi:hypothetical protein